MSDYRQIKIKLQELSEVTPDAEMTRRAIAATRAVLVRESSPDRAASWEFTMFPIKIAIAMVAVLFFGTAILISLISGSSAQIAYAEVVAEIERVNTIQYLETRTGKSPDGELNSPTEVTQVTILGRSRERREVVSVKKGDPLTDGSEWSMPVLGFVSISDLERGILVGLNVKTKTFHVSNNILSMSPDDGKVTSTEVKPAPEVDLYKRIRDFPAEKAKRLPAQKIDGKNVVGFRTIETVKRKRGVDTLIRTYWIAPETRLPVQIEATSKSTDPSMGQSRWLISDIAFDEPIDEGLLSTEPPDGYTVLEEK